VTCGCQLQGRLLELGDRCGKLGIHVGSGCESGGVEFLLEGGGRTGVVAFT
jgi:hypothetical protein